MHHDLLFETNRFNLSEVKMYFINPCCFGEDVAMWLREKLIQQGLETDEPGQEDCQNATIAIRTFRSASIALICG